MDKKNIEDRKVKLLALQCIELLTQQLQKLNNQQSRSTFAKGGSVGSLMDNGRIDQPMKPLSMQPMQVMQQMRTKLANGGTVDDDLGQIQYLISVLESGHLTPIEAKLLEDLYDDLRKIQGGSK
jgi:hypothetical protein